MLHDAAGPEHVDRVAQHAVTVAEHDERAFLQHFTGLQHELLRRAWASAPENANMKMTNTTPENFLIVSTPGSWQWSEGPASDIIGKGPPGIKTNRLGNCRNPGVNLQPQVAASLQR
jgi:hypothetical protein